MFDVILDLVKEAALDAPIPSEAVNPTNLTYLEASLDNGFTQLGQLHITNVDGGFELRHLNDQDKDPDQLTTCSQPSDARDIALYNDSGEYRPLRTSPDLKTGWRLHVNDLQGLLHALDYFYPAAVGLSRIHATGSLDVCHFRDKLGRQTGMYRSARTISDPGANELINRCCDRQTSCLKHRLWGLTASKGTELENTEPQGDIDLICQEPCNILVSEARKAAKREVIKIVE